MGYLVERQVNSQTAQIGASAITIPVIEMLNINRQIDGIVQAILGSYGIAGEKTKQKNISSAYKIIPGCSGAKIEETDYACLISRLPKLIPFMDSLVKKLVIDLPNRESLWTMIKHFFGSGVTYTGWADVIRQWGLIKDRIPTVLKEATDGYAKFLQEKDDKKGTLDKTLKTITTVAVSLAVIVVGVKVIPMISKVIPKRRG